MRYRVFIRWTLAACAIWASVYVGVGYLAHTSYDKIGTNLKFGGLIFVAIILIFLIIVHFAKKRLEKTAFQMVADDKLKQFEKLED